MSEYFNKTDEGEIEDEDDPDAATDAWGDLNTNDWGHTAGIDTHEEKFDEFSTSSMKPSNPMKTTPMTKTAAKETPSASATVPTNSASWVQEKPSTSQSRNDWDSDAFFNDVLNTASKPKLKTNRH